VFLIRLPDPFTPEEYGWHRHDDFEGPHQQHERFGVYRRKRKPHPGYESLVICKYDEEHDALGAWFYPLPLPERETLGTLWERLRDDPRSTEA
jgi:hypothetical protein